MYKTSFALASLLAFADALYLKSSCGPCCDGGDDDEINEETQEVIDDFEEELDIDPIVEPEDIYTEGGLVGGEGMGEPCATEVDAFFEDNGFIRDQLVDADLAIEKINFQYMNDNWSRQESNHWFNWLGQAD